MLFATGKTIPRSEHMSLHYTNNRPFLKLKKKAIMQRLCKINKEQASTLVEGITGESSKFINLVHSSKYLIYKISTEHYKLEINAIDGSIIKKESK